MSDPQLPRPAPLSVVETDHERAIQLDFDLHRPAYQPAQISIDLKLRVLHNVSMTRYQVLRFEHVREAATNDEVADTEESTDRRRIRMSELERRLRRLHAESLNLTILLMPVRGPVPYRTTNRCHLYLHW